MFCHCWHNSWNWLVFTFADQLSTFAYSESLGMGYSLQTGFLGTLGLVGVL